MAKASTNEIAKVLNRIQGHDNYTVIRDFFEISAIAIRNNVDYGKERDSSWEHEESPDNVFICREKDIVIVLTDDEYNFISHMADDEGDHSYYESLCDGCTTKFVNDYTPDWDSEG